MTAALTLQLQLLHHVPLSAAFIVLTSVHGYGVRFASCLVVPTVALPS